MLTTNALISSASTVGNASLRMIPNVYKGFAVRITQGLGTGQERLITGNTQTVLSTSAAWDIQPDASSTFVISQAAYQLGATGQGNRFQFEVPNREGTVVQILGRSANAAGAECPAELSPLTRWKIGGAGIRTVDTDIPGAPAFGLSLSSSLNGTLELGQVGFVSLSNTASVAAGTLTLYWQDELSTAAPLSLESALDAGETSLRIAAAKGTLLRIDQEIIRVDDIAPDGTLTIARGIFGTPPANYSAGQPIIVLRRSLTTVPFIRNFFGTPASGNWTYTVNLENARIAAAEFYVTNSQGNSPITSQAYTDTLDRGLRTLSGGQYSFQVSGVLAVDNSPAPEVVLETDHVIGDVFAYLGEAATGSDLQLELNVNGSLLCALIIPSGTEVSNGVRGADFPALRRGDRLSVSVQSIGSVLPGSDLTVVVRI